MEKTSLSKVTAKLALIALLVILFISPLFILQGFDKDWQIPINRIINDIKNANYQSSFFPSPEKLTAEPVRILIAEEAVFFVYSSVYAFALVPLFLAAKMRQGLYHPEKKRLYSIFTCFGHYIVQSYLALCPSYIPDAKSSLAQLKSDLAEEFGIT